MNTLLRTLVFGGVGFCTVAGGAQTAPAPPAATPAQSAAAARPTPTVEQQLATLQKRMLDWAQLGYYRERNEALAAPAAGEQRVVFFGDSITEIWGRSWKASFGDKPYRQAVCGPRHQRADIAADGGAISPGCGGPASGGSGDPGWHERYRGEDRPDDAGGDSG